MAEVDAPEPSKPATPRLPPLARLLGLAIAASALLPFSPAGAPFWQLARDAFEQSIGGGLIVTFAYGAPFWFGLALALAPSAERDLLWRRITQSLLGLLHGQLLLTAWLIARAGVGVAAWPLLGFALVSGLHFISQSGRMSAASSSMSGAPPSVWWLARWGAVMVVALSGWLRLQSLAGLELGIAVEVAAIAAMLATWQITRGARTA